jgi:hypothetical protein
MNIVTCLVGDTDFGLVTGFIWLLQTVNLIHYRLSLIHTLCNPLEYSLTCQFAVTLTVAWKGFSMSYLSDSSWRPSHSKLSF